MTVADTSFLYSLYGDDTHSPKAIAWIRKQTQPITITALTEFELSNAFRFAAFRSLLPTRLVANYWQHFIEDREAGRIKVYQANLAKIILIATRLSEQHTSRRGHRSFDILHVAGALEIGAAGFLSFDRNQRKLAESEGLVSPI